MKPGIAAVSSDAAGAVVCLGDMPLIDAKLLDRLIAAFDPDRGALIAVPVSEGRRGNPVLWSRRFFDELLTLDGDTGARHLIAKHAEAVAEVPVEGKAHFSTSIRRRRWKRQGGARCESPPGFATNAPLVQFRSFAEEPFLDRHPFRIGRDVH